MYCYEPQKLRDQISKMNCAIKYASKVELKWRGEKCR